MNAPGWIAVAAIVISVLTFIATQRGAHDTGLSTTVRDLRDRNKDLEEERERLKTRLDALEWENVTLMRKLNAMMDVRDREKP